MVVVLGAASVAPAAAAASSSAAPAPATGVAARGLFDGLPAPVGQLLTQITGGLTGVLPASGVATLTDALDALDPAGLAAVLGTLSPAQLAQVVAAGPDGLGPLLTGVLSTVTGLVSGLPAGGGAAAPPELDAVLQQLTGLLAGVPGGDPASLATLTQVLDGLTTLLGLPGVTQLPALGPLVGALLQVRGELPDGPARDAVDETLTTIVNAVGTLPLVPELTSLGPTAASGTSATASVVGLPAPGATDPKPAPLAAQARIRSVVISRDRRRVRVRVSCPRAATSSCRIIVSAKLRGAKLRVTRRATVRVGATTTVTARVPAGTVRAVRRAGGPLLVRVGTSGSGKAAVAKTVAVRRTAR
jgi:hypothetical protein